jgi:hypothetical protein
MPLSALWDVRSNHRDCLRHNGLPGHNAKLAGVLIATPTPEKDRRWNAQSATRFLPVLLLFSGPEIHRVYQTQDQQQRAPPERRMQVRRHV